ncbi:hypothetical protein [Streptomyces sp. NPDC002913]
MFSLTPLLVGASQTQPWLIGARASRGIGATPTPSAPGGSAVQPVLAVVAVLTLIVPARGTSEERHN